MRPSRLLLAIPLVLFAALAGVFAVRVGDGADRQAIPSALIGRAAPAAAFAPLRTGEPGLDPADFRGKVSLVNIFASWCAPCRVEHPLLVDLAATPGLTMVGINYKDKADAAQRFLADLGDPYDIIGADPEGRGAIDWGVTGVPETFLVDAEGMVRAKHVGPLTEAALQGSFGDTLARLLAEQTRAAGS